MKACKWTLWMICIQKMKLMSWLVMGQVDIIINWFLYQKTAETFHYGIPLGQSPWDEMVRLRENTSERCDNKKLKITMIKTRKHFNENAKTRLWKCGIISRFHYRRFCVIHHSVLEFSSSYFWVFVIVPLRFRHLVRMRKLLTAIFCIKIKIK